MRQYFNLFTYTLLHDHDLLIKTAPPPSMSIIRQGKPFFPNVILIVRGTIANLNAIQTRQRFIKCLVYIAWRALPSPFKKMGRIFLWHSYVTLCEKWTQNSSLNIFLRAERNYGKPRASGRKCQIGIPVSMSLKKTRTSNTFYLMYSC